MTIVRFTEVLYLRSKRRLTESARPMKRAFFGISRKVYTEGLLEPQCGTVYHPASVAQDTQVIDITIGPTRKLQHFADYDKQFDIKHNTSHILGTDYRCNGAFRSVRTRVSSSTPGFSSALYVRKMLSCVFTHPAIVTLHPYFDAFGVSGADCTRTWQWYGAFDR